MPLNNHRQIVPSPNSIGQNPIRFQDPLSAAEPPNEQLFADRMGLGYRVGTALKQILSAQLLHTFNALQLGVYAILIYQYAYPDKYETENCANGYAITQDAGLIAYFWGFILALLGGAAVYSAAEAITHDHKTASTIYRVKSELSSAFATATYNLYLAPRLGLTWSSTTTIPVSILTGLHPLISLIMRAFYSDFGRGDHGDYDWYASDLFKNKIAIAIAKVTGIVLESLSNGCNLMATFVTALSLAVDIGYDSAHNTNFQDPRRYGKEYTWMMITVASLGMLLGIITTKKNSWQTFMGKTANFINMTYVTWLASLRIQGCTVRGIYDPAEVVHDGDWKYEMGWGFFAVFIAGISCVKAFYINDTYNAVACERYLIRRFKCQPWDRKLSTVIKNVVTMLGNIPITLLNTLSPAILAEPSYENGGYQPLATEPTPLDDFVTQA